MSLTLLFLTDLQHGVQHVDLAGLVSGLRESKALRWSDPGNPLNHSLHTGEFHQHVLVLRSQPAHVYRVVNGLTQHLEGSHRLIIM